MQASHYLPGWSTSPPHSSQKPPFLHQTMSVSNFRDDPWDWPRSPPSPSASSSSSASRSMTPQASNNPWASSVSIVSPDTESTSSSPPRFLPCPTPPSLSRSVTPTTSSRCATPVAPQPLNGARPLFITMGSPGPASPTDDAKLAKPADLLPAPTPNPFRESVGVSLAPLANAIITPALEKQYVHRESPTLISRQGWERSTGQRAYTWALGNSRTALLFLMCDDIAAWRRASFYWLEDSKLPFEEADLEGIAANPKKVVENQWRVMARELHQNGQHTDFQPREVVPLQQVSTVTSSPSGNKAVDKVRWMGEDNGRVYIRKRFTFERHAEKLALLSQIQKVKTLEHVNVSRIVCSYAQGAAVGFVTAQAQLTLEEYLQHPVAPTRPGLLLTWINDLTQALAYIHSMDLLHQSIRPNKILLDGPRIMFSAFGISTESTGKSPRGSPPRSYSGSNLNPHVNNTIRTLSDAAYIYAAPEVVARQGQGHRYRTSADIFSLGCVFLEMLTVAKGQTVTNLRAYRAQFSHDNSFHQNLDRIASWRKLLTQLSSGHRDSRINTGLNNSNHPLLGLNGVGTVENRKEDEAAEYQALMFVGAMMNAESARRPKMRQLAPAMKRLNDTRTVRKRRSFDAGDTAHVPPPAPTPISAPLNPLSGGMGAAGRGWGVMAEKDGFTTKGSLISF